MDERSDDFELLLRQASGRRGLEPLLRALGFTPHLRVVPAAARRAYGLSGEGSVRQVIIAGERGGLRTLLLELRSLDSPAETARLARRIRSQNSVQPLFFLFAGPYYRRLGFASFGTRGEFRQLLIERSHPRRSDLEALSELAAREGEGGIELLHRHARALDRTRLTRQFFRDFRAQRDLISAAWLGIGNSGDELIERDQLSLLLLCRLLFLYFLQKSGHLNRDPAYLLTLFGEWSGRSRAGSPGNSADPGGSGRIHTFYRAILQPLFFGALNTRPEHRAPTTDRLGPLPYLNGGLFDPHPLERRLPELDLEDSVIAGIFHDLLERYRFTTREAAESAVDEVDEMGVDPEMLGQVFEELMASDRREASGTFYTPAIVVDRLVDRALDLWLGKSREYPRAGTLPEQRADLSERLAGIRVLDPACGSGAFLLGALYRIAQRRAALEGGDAAEYRREIVGRSLFGVDLQGDAALLCALRLWLALTLTGQGEVPEPLPNLDRQIRQGDALIDPIDLIDPGKIEDYPANDPTLRRALRVIGPLARRYLDAEPDERPGLQRELNGAEISLAQAWLEGSRRRLTHQITELRTTALSPDLFGELPSTAPILNTTRRALEFRLDEVDRLLSSLAEAGTLPFFSFDIHFADPSGRGFDLILSNPPWVRAHRWPAGLGKQVRGRYTVSRSAGWRLGTSLAGTPAAAGAQVDLSLLFLERSVRLLEPGGVLAMLLPAKAIRSLYGGGGRRLLLQETRLDYLEDHSLDQRSIFRADAFTAAIVAERGSTRSIEEDRELRDIQITMIRRGASPLTFETPAAELPLIPGDPAAPWLIVPPKVRGVIRKMQAAGPPLGSVAGYHVRRGIATGANDIFLTGEVEVKLGGLSWIRAEGYNRAIRSGRPAIEARRFEALIEGEVLRPIVRGSGVGAWRYSADTNLIWVHDDLTATPISPPDRTASYLARHRDTLEARSGWNPRLPPGTIFRARPDTVGPKVAWRDLAADLEAVALPDRVRGPIGRDVPIIPLNTVYYIPTTTYEDALLLAALLNSLPVRTFARSIAERAKDARFRFFAWTIALLPLPEGWASGPAVAELLRLSRAAHTLGGIAPDSAVRLDEIIASLYRISASEFDALQEFDHWLRGVPEP